MWAHPSTLGGLFEEVGAHPPPPLPEGGPLDSPWRNPHWPYDSAQPFDGLSANGGPRLPEGFDHLADSESDDDGGQANRHLEEDVGGAGEVGVVSEEADGVDAEGGEGGEAAEDAYDEECVDLGAQRLVRLGEADDEADEEAAHGVHGQGAVGEPGGAESAVQPHDGEVAGHGSEHASGPDAENQHALFSSSSRS